MSCLFQGHTVIFSDLGLKDNVVLILYLKGETALLEVPDCDTDPWTAGRWGSHSRQGDLKGRREAPATCALLSSPLLSRAHGGGERPEVSFSWVSPCRTQEGRRKTAVSVPAPLCLSNYISLLGIIYGSSSTWWWFLRAALCLRPGLWYTLHGIC